jgi:sigma-B regulation protein RsbU (phosphoserine phosphatase)
MADDGFTRESILVVDDKAENLHLLTRMLTERGYTVRAANNGYRALESVQASPPNIVLLDIRMPDMDGYEVCRQLKNDPGFHEIPIIFISALEEIRDKVKGFEVGGVDYITKPFQFEEVIARIETHLALRRYQKELENAKRKLEAELALAGTLQTSMLPGQEIEIPGYQMASALKPALETSGDFYDVFPLDEDHVGLILADVVDKGAAAALLMALSRTLVRTFAPQQCDHPDLVLQSVNRRMLLDTATAWFVTTFYAVLELDSGALTFCNAGHNPPIFLREPGSGLIDTLEKTGLPLGISDDRVWTKGAVRMEPGSAILLYTDGVIDLRNEAGDFFGFERLADFVRAHSELPVNETRVKLLDELIRFKGDASQVDDMAFMLLKRERS